MKPKRLPTRNPVFWTALCCVLVGVCFGAYQILVASESAKVSQTERIISPSETVFDHDTAKQIARFDALTETYWREKSTTRPLREYYARRQYPGSPPIISHPVNVKFGEDPTCLACHGKGGYVEKWRRYAPITPHPEASICQQCHVISHQQDPFVGTDWVQPTSIRLGLARLPGAPPPFPHGLQNREDCVACHTGPGAVNEIRMNHEARGICRQCHVPATDISAFNR